MANTARRQESSARTRTVIELQRIELRPERTPEGLRITRQAWEILRRKQGCLVQRLYHSLAESERWLAYSEWSSLAELGGARRELARSPLYRRWHSTMRSSSERAYEPFGAIHSIRGDGLGPPTTAMVATMARAGAEEKDPLSFLQQLPGYLSHILMHDVAEPDTVLCLAHFASPEQASAASAAIGEHEAARALHPVVELFAS